MTKTLQQNILITGSNGFIGSATLKEFLSRGHNAVGISRERKGGCITNLKSLGYDTNRTIDWDEALDGIDTVVHCAGAAKSKNSRNGAKQLWDSNYKLTVDLAQCSIGANIKTFIFISTVKVLGDTTNAVKQFKEDDPLAPRDAYGFSKAAAEFALRQIFENTSVRLIIVRPPIVYGREKQTYFRWIKVAILTGLPLPFKNFDSKRSIVSIQNLTDFIVSVSETNFLNNEVLHVSDGLDLTVEELVLLVSRILGKNNSVFLLNSLFRWCFCCNPPFNKIMHKLVTPCSVDSTKTKQLVGWHPRLKTKDGLELLLRK